MSDGAEREEKMQEAENNFDRVMRKIDNALNVIEKNRSACSTGRIQAFQREAQSISPRSIVADTSDSLPVATPTGNGSSE